MKCRWCGDETAACEQINGSCGWLLVAGDVSRSNTRGRFDKSAATPLVRKAVEEHFGMIVGMVRSKSR